MMLLAALPHIFILKLSRKALSERYLSRATSKMLYTK